MRIHITFNHILRDYYGPRVQKEELGGLKTGLKYQVVLYGLYGQTNLFDTGSIYNKDLFWYFKSYYYKTDYQLAEFEYELTWTMKLLGRHWDDPNLN